MYPYGPDIVIRFVYSQEDVPAGQKFRDTVSKISYVAWGDVCSREDPTQLCRERLIDFVVLKLEGRNKAYLHITKDDGLRTDKYLKDLVDKQEQ
jgi:hypothetical protein